MAAIKRFISRLLGRGAVDEARDNANIARARESDRQHRLVRKAKTTISHATPEPRPGFDVDRARSAGALAVLLACGVILSGCAVLKAALPELMKSYGLPDVTSLLADAKERGKVAIDEARDKAEAIPDQLDRIEALAEISRAEAIYQTNMLEYLVSQHPPETEAAPETR